MEYGGGTSVYPQVSITLACSAGDRSRAVRAAAQIEHVRCVDHSSGSPWRYVDTTPVVIEYHEKVLLLGREKSVKNIAVTSFVLRLTCATGWSTGHAIMVD